MALSQTVYARAHKGRPAVSSQAADGRNSDGALVQRVLAGQGRAFDLIVLRYQERVRNSVRRLVRDSDDVEDIAQETFIRAHSRLHDFRGQASLFTWLYRIAVNLSINHLRKQQARSFCALSDGSGELQARGGPEEDLRASEVGLQVDQAVADLPPRQRAIFGMRYYDQYSHREIARILGNSEGAVRAGYFHAVQKLQVSLAAVVGV
ncbi:MAG: sigma-70 family RNA polymerase sigma factor [Candidatus Latescibacteria bacterium]|nr:sigma-70 family RNA polymerase sigma factor [Candidatus Latescibacterota bacterium]